MKKMILAISACIIALSSCQTEGNYTIKGDIANLDSEKIFLVNYVDNKPVAIDSAEVKNNSFVIEGRIDIPTKCYLYKNIGDRRSVANLYVENTDISIKGDAKKLTEIVIIGGKEQALDKKFDSIDKTIKEKTKPLNDQYMKLMAKKEDLGDKFNKEVEILEKKYDSIIKSANLETVALIKSNLSSITAMDRLYRNSRNMEIKETKTILDSLVGDATKAPSYTKLKEKIVLLENVEIGKQAPDFTLPTPDGEKLSLSSFKGKLLILDFWASWCGPCRQENPNVVKLYNKYHSQGLEILSVSLDDNREKWLKAIKDDGLVWNHVSDLQGWSNKAAKLYAVSGIPHIVLISKEGVILAKNLRGEELENKLKEYIN